MSYSCESFINYQYDGEEALEAFHPLRGIKERLKKICTFLYKKCNSAYESNKESHPKVASAFKGLANFFKKHSTLVDKINTQADAQKETKVINEAQGKVSELNKKSSARHVKVYRYTDINGESTDFDNEEEFKAFSQKKEEERQKSIKEGKARMAEREAQNKKLREEQQKRMEAEYKIRQMEQNKEQEEWKKHQEEEYEKGRKEREKQNRLHEEKIEYSKKFVHKRGELKPSKPFIEACNRGNLEQIRHILAFGVVTWDKNFKANLEYAKRNVSELFVEHKDFYEDVIYRRPNAWERNKRKFIDLLETNFSHKRLKQTEIIAKMTKNKK